MTKLSKKLVALLLAVVMTIAMSATAFAAFEPQGSGSITVTNATVEQSYAGYKIFDVTYSGSGEDLLQSYVITNDNQFYGEVAASKLFTLTKTTVDGVYNVALADGTTDEAVITWLNGLISEDSSYRVDLNETIATSDTVVWNEVPYGYYLITSSLGSVVTVNQNTPDINIIDKNQNGGTDFTKTVGEDDVMQIGVPFTFTLKFTATNYDNERKIQKYTISDTFPEGMDLVETENNVQIKIEDGSETPKNFTKSISLDENRGFTFDIPWTDENGNSLYNSPATVTVTYQAVLNEDAEIEGNGETNKATLGWDGKPEGEVVTGKDTVYTYALAVKKVDKNGTGLNGAEFELKDAEGTVVNVSQVDGQSGVYVIDPEGSAVITSPDGGVIVIKGVDNANYTLTETKAPNGYNLLENPVNVTPVATRMTETNTTIHLDAEGNVVDESASVTTVTITSDIPATAVAVLNQAGTLLPSTGGMGTTVIYVVGAALVIGAGIVLVVRRRMNADR